MMLYRVRMTCLIVLLALTTQAKAAEPAQAASELPLWELGIGVGAFSMPQYMGSDERYTFPFAFPYIIYRGEHWRIDRGGLRNRLFNSKRLSLDASFSFGLPVKNSNHARQGMPYLHLYGAVGPQLNIELFDAGEHNLRASLPVRAAMDIRGHWLGWLSDPYLRYTYLTPKNDGWLRVRLDVGMLFASQRFNDAYYSVAPVYATATRPVYQAKAGLHSIFTRLHLRYPVSRDWQIFTAFQLRSLAPGVIANSPLVKKTLYTSVAAGVIWTWKRASKQSRSNEEEF